MAWTSTLRREIADEFAALTPTQWSALRGAWRFKHPQYWDNRGEIYNRPLSSTAYQWQANVLLYRLRKESEKWERDIRRHRMMRKHTQCPGCGTFLDHEGHIVVRKYCNLQCQYQADKNRADSIKKEYAMRQCDVCPKVFHTLQHGVKKTCSARCLRVRTSRLRKEKNRQRKNKKG